MNEASIQNPKNDPKNLRFLAAQSLLLASKFMEIQRLYPAELVYQVKGWNEKEYNILKQGALEEYILHILGFDLIYLTPSDFLNFFSGAWNHAQPCKSCQKCGDISSHQHKSVGLKIDFVAHEICKHITSTLLS